jgi:hypothetical protein
MNLGAARVEVAQAPLDVDSRPKNDPASRMS